MSISTIERELDAIRIRHYEQTKDMTPDERVAYIKESIAPTMRQYGLRTVARALPDDSTEATPVSA